MNADIHTLTGAYALNALSDAERVAFEQHLDECAACRKEVAELQETASRLSASVASPPDDELKRRITDRIAHVRQLPPRKGKVLPMRGRGWPIRVTALAAAASVIAAVVLGVRLFDTNQDLERAESQLRELRTSQSEFAEVLTADDARHVSGGGDGISATVVLSQEHRTMVFLPDQLPEPGENKAYQLWMLGSGEPVSAGVLPDPARPVVVDVTTDASELGVTVEPEGGSDQPTSDPVMTMALR